MSTSVVTSYIVKHRSVFCAGLLILVHICLLAGFLSVNSLTVDEPVHIAGGMEILQNGGHNLNPESGVLPQVVPGLVMGAFIKMPPELTMENNSLLPYNYTRYIFFKWNRITEFQTLLARLACSIFSIVCAILVFAVSRRMAGSTAALLTLTLYVFMPLMISNGSLATADTAVTAGFFATLFFCTELLRRLTFRNFVFASAAATCLILSKMSGGIIAPILFTILILASFSKSRFTLGGRFELKGFARRFAAGFVAFAGAACVAYVLLWAAYGFRAELPQTENGVKRIRYIEVFKSYPRSFISDTAVWMGEKHIVPEAFAYGFLHTYHNAQERWAYLDGKTSYTGFREFFPLVFLYKTPPPLILAYLAGLAAAFALFRKKSGRARLKVFMPYALFGVTFFIMALFSNLNIGYRHLMPSIVILLPVTALGFRAFMRMKFLKTIPYLLTVWLICESLSAYPHSLSYFSWVFGGTDEAHRHVIDSSLDWGQDAKNIKPALEKHGVPLDGSENLYLVYFGCVPEEECGLDNAKILKFSLNDGGDENIFEFKEGYYVVSATFAHGFKFHKAGPLLRNPDLWIFRQNYYDVLDGRIPREKYLARLYGTYHNYQSLLFELIRRGFENRRPDFTVNGSVNVYKLTKEDISSFIGRLGRGNEF